MQDVVLVREFGECGFRDLGWAIRNPGMQYQNYIKERREVLEWNKLETSHTLLKANYGFVLIFVWREDSQSLKSN